MILSFQGIDKQINTEFGPGRLTVSSAGDRTHGIAQRAPGPAGLDGTKAAARSPQRHEQAEGD